MGDIRKPIEEIAAEEIAADEQRSRDWVSPKAIAGLPVPQPQQNPFAWLLQFGLVPIVGGLVLLLVAVFGAFAVLQPGGVPPATPTAPAVAEATPTAGEPTAQPTPAPEPTPAPTLTPGLTPAPTATPTDAAPPTEPPTDGPTGTPGRPFTVPKNDEMGDAVTDSGVAVPDDAVVDITNIVFGVVPDGLALLISHAAPLPVDADPGVSRASQVVGGATVEASSGIRPAQATNVALKIWFWQIHDGEITMGAFDAETGEALPTEASIEHRESNGSFAFFIPSSELEGIEWVGIVSYHRPTPADERRRDVFGPVFLDQLAPQETT